MRKFVKYLVSGLWFMLFLFFISFFSTLIVPSFSLFFAGMLFVFCVWSWSNLISSLWFLFADDCECCNRGVCFCDYLNVEDRCKCFNCKVSLLVD